jgi:hypothetical protein
MKWRVDGRSQGGSAITITGACQVYSRPSRLRHTVNMCNSASELHAVYPYESAGPPIFCEKRGEKALEITLSAQEHI